MINNIHEIAKRLDFFDKDCFYFMQVVKRRKDNPGMKKDHRVISRYYIDSMGMFDKAVPVMMEEAGINNARVYIHLNKRNFTTVALKTAALIPEMVLSGEARSVKSAYDRVCGKYHSDRIKKWIVDVDTKDVGILNYTVELVRSLQTSVKGDKFLYTLPTLNGYHIICSPFNRGALPKMPPAVEIKTDSPTVLYIP